jgi:hypothetical protein
MLSISILKWMSQQHKMGQIRVTILLNRIQRSYRLRNKKKAHLSQNQPLRLKTSYHLRQQQQAYNQPHEGILIRQQLMPLEASEQAPDGRSRHQLRQPRL